MTVHSVEQFSGDSTRLKDILELQKKEVILRPSPLQFVFIENESDVYYKLYKIAESLFWTSDEVDFTQDEVDWKEKLTDNERYYIKHVLAFFSASDGIVNLNLAQKVIPKVQLPTATAFYDFQKNMENTHAFLYAKKVFIFIKDEQERHRILNAIETIPAIQKKAQWALKWIEREDVTFAEQIIAFAAVEGIFFSGSFCAIFWLKKRGLMPGLTFANELISRDEGLHCDFACVVHNNLEYTKCNPARIYEILVEAAEIEKEFVSESLPVDLIGINKVLVCQYIEFVTDHWLIQLGLTPYYKVVNPFDWMVLISLVGKTNNFERRNGEYNKPVSSDSEAFKVRFDNPKFHEENPEEFKQVSYAVKGLKMSF